MYRVAILVFISLFGLCSCFDQKDDCSSKTKHTDRVLSIDAFPVNKGYQCFATYKICLVNKGILSDVINYNFYNDHGYNRLGQNCYYSNHWYVMAGDFLDYLGKLKDQTRYKSEISYSGMTIYRYKKTAENQIVDMYSRPYCFKKVQHDKPKKIPLNKQDNPPVDWFAEMDAKMAQEAQEKNKMPSNTEPEQSVFSFFRR